MADELIDDLRPRVGEDWPNHWERVKTTLQAMWRPIETARKEYEDGQPPILTWGPHGYGLTYGPTKDGGYGPQTMWMPLWSPPVPNNGGR
jgi:hypothetical protein